MLSRQPSLTISRSDFGDDDTFERILQVTSHHEAIMAYYYLDENKVKVTEIFDVTDSSDIKTAALGCHNIGSEEEWDEATWIERPAHGNIPV